MQDKILWSRRKFSKAAFSLQVLIASGTLNLLTGCITGETSKNGKIINSSQERLLQLVMDEIIPKSDKMPSASDVGGMDYILSVFTEYPDLVEGFIQILTQLEEQSKASTKEEFGNLNKQSRIEVLKTFEKARTGQFLVLQNIVYESYYINEKVWELIGYKPYPTLLPGPQMAPFDESLLARVKQMSSLYLNT